MAGTSARSSNRQTDRQRKTDKRIDEEANRYTKTQMKGKSHRYKNNYRAIPSIGEKDEAVYKDR